MIGVILLVILIFGILVFVHEFGHFITARRGGITVEEFGFGFPPRLFGIQKGETLYSINLIPFGGFVRMKGEDNSDTTPGSFGAASFKRKLAVLLAGVGMNLLIAYALFLYLGVTGLPGGLQQDLGLPVPQHQSASRVIVLDESTDSPAYMAGIRRGDVIVGASDQSFGSEQALIDFSKSHAGQSVAYTVARDGQQRRVTVQLRPAEAGEKLGYLGVTPLAVSSITYGWQSIWVAAYAAVEMVWLTIVGFVGAVVGLFVHQQVSAGVIGPVGVVTILSNIMYLGVNYVLFFIASISISLAALNVLPIPALDGGRVAVLLAGKAMGRPVSARTEGLIHTIGFVLLLVFMAVITVVDIARLG